MITGIRSCARPIPNSRMPKGGRNQGVLIAAASRLRAVVVTGERPVPCRNREGGSVERPRYHERIRLRWLGRLPGPKCRTNAFGAMGDAPFFSVQQARQTESRRSYSLEVPGSIPGTATNQVSQKPKAISPERVTFTIT